MKVFLIYIRDEDFYRLLPPELGDSRFSEGRVQVMAFPPIGIETLAPIVRQHGHEVRMFDTCHPLMKEEHISEAVRDEKPDLIALSFLSTTAYHATSSMAHRLKQAAPHTPIIVGGVFATINAREILGESPDIDYVARGEGEELFPEFLENLASPGKVGGLVWRSGSEIIENPPRPIIEDLDQFPYPDRKSLPIDYIESMPLDVPAVLSLDRFCTMQTSRGCPNKCVYCGIPSLADRKWRHRSPEHVLGEMQQLNDEGYRSIYLTDDQFLLNRTRIGAICQGIIDRKLEFNWGCEGRVDSIATDQFPIMAMANCNFLAFGIEAGSQKVLDRLKKKQTLEQVEHAVSEANRCGIENIHGFFLVGSPEETDKEIMKSFHFAARLKLDTFGFNRLRVYRGTPLWQEYVEKGIIDDKRDWKKWFKCTDIDPTTLQEKIVLRTRQKGYLLLFLSRIVLRPFQTMRLLRRFGRHMKLTDILKLLGSPFRKRSLTLEPLLPSPMIDRGMTAPTR
ncbi:MAG: radical SAM protein [Geobacteraceae bacterium]|nr:radical SAM protein [Geobacteraceae bacterium]